MKRLILFTTTVLVSSAVLAGGGLFGGGDHSKNPNGVKSIAVELCGVDKCPEFRMIEGACTDENSYKQYGTCLCNAGFVPVEGKCKPCPEGYYSDGQHECIKCGPGTHSVAGTTECKPCEGATYSPGGTDECYECPQHANCSNENFSCKEGFYATGGSWETLECVCNDGTTLSTGDTCVTCASLHKGNGTGGECGECLSGYKDDGKGGCEEDKCHNVSCSITGQTCNSDTGECECLEGKVSDGTKCIDVVASCPTDSTITGTGGVTGLYIKNGGLAAECCCPTGKKWNGSSCIDVVARTTPCASYDTNECGTGYYCNFDSANNCRPDSARGEGTCKKITDTELNNGYSSWAINWWSAYSFCKGLPGNKSMPTLAQLDISAPRWWYNKWCDFPDSGDYPGDTGYSEGSFTNENAACKSANGTVMTPDNAYKTKWAELKGKYSVFYFWIQDLEVDGDTSNSCYAFTVNMGDGYVDRHTRDHRISFAVCE